MLFLSNLWILQNFLILCTLLHRSGFDIWGSLWLSLVKWQNHLLQVRTLMPTPTSDLKCKCLSRRGPPRPRLPLLPLTLPVFVRFLQNFLHGFLITYLFVYWLKCLFPYLFGSSKRIGILFCFVSLYSQHLARYVAYPQIFFKDGNYSRCQRCN